jgi:hypothetical protein
MQLLLAVGLFVFLGPYWALLQLGLAIRDKDIPAIDRAIDFPSVRTSVKSEVRRAFDEVERAAPKKPFSLTDLLKPVGEALRTSAVEVVVDQTLKAENVPDLVEKAQEAMDKGILERRKVTSAFYDGWNRFAVRLDDGTAIYWTRTNIGLSWRLTGVSVPALKSYLNILMPTGR